MKLQFDEEGKRFYENGVDHGVLFVKNGPATNHKKYIYQDVDGPRQVGLVEVDSTSDIPLKYESTNLLFKVSSSYYVVVLGDGAYETQETTVEAVQTMPAEPTTGKTYEFSFTSAYTNGVAWNGLTSVSQTPEGAEAEDVYADNMKYLTLTSAETFGATINAYTYPDAFAACDGQIIKNGIVLGQQKRTPFAFAYRTIKGNDNGEETHILHIVYGAKASPSEKEYSTVNDSPEAMEMSWEIKTTPIAVDATIDGVAVKPIAYVEIREDANKVIYDTIEAMILGSSAADSVLPTPEELIPYMQ